jgi:hypothetical protein
LIITKELLENQGACEAGITNFTEEWEIQIKLTYEVWIWAKRQGWLDWAILNLLEGGVAQACLMYLSDQRIHRNPPYYNHPFCRACLNNILHDVDLTREQIQMLVDIINDE